MLSDIQINFRIEILPKFHYSFAKGRFFFRKCDAFFKLPKKCTKNYPEQEIRKLRSVTCKQNVRENSE